MSMLTWRDDCRRAAGPQPSRASHAALGGLLVAGCALAIFAVARWLRDRRLGSPNPEALQASRMGAGPAPLAAGALRLGLDRPKKRNQRADRGIWRGPHGGRDRWARAFARPRCAGSPKASSYALFFVVLGARLDLTALADHPRLLALSGGLIGLSIVIHVIARIMTRQPPGSGLIATAQLGVPAAVVQIGLLEQVITAAEGAAIIVAALASLVACAVGVSILAGRISRAETS